MLNHMKTTSIAIGLLLICLGTVRAQSPLIDATFDGLNNDTNNLFQLISNTPAHTSGASWTPSTGVLNRGSNANSTAGVVSETTLDVAALGSNALVLVVTVEDGSGTLGANGLFVGLQEADGGADAGGELWNNLGPSFGLVIDGGNRLGSYAVAPGGNINLSGTSGSGFQDAPAFGTTTAASINDGFIVTITLSTGGWSMDLTGLTTSGGAPIQGGAGTWGDTTFDFSQFTAGMRVAVTTQGPAGGGSLDFSRIQVLLDGDTDGDGMPDSYETANGLDKNNPADAGLDNDSLGGADGLTNLEEFSLGTDPQDADTDDDGLRDGDEVHGTLNPWTAGVQGTPPGDPTNPRNPDSDGDGDSDSVELTNGTDPNALPPNTGPLFPFVDTDGDRYRDEAETALGTNPADPASAPDFTSSAPRPNVVIIYADDMGLGDMSAYGSMFGTPSPAVTPHMDQLAAEGVLFSQAHSSNAVCTPSRYALLTGKYNWRLFNGITVHYGWASDANKQEVPLHADVTIAEFLKTQGYDTAAFGKWHLGGTWYQRNSNTRVTGNPTSPSTVDWARRVDDHAVDHGFDIFRGLATTINMGPYVFMEDDRHQFWDTGLNGGAGGFRNATNTDPFHWFTTSELNASVVGNKDSRASLGDPSYRQVDAGPIMIDQVETYFTERAQSGDTDPFMAYVSLYSPHMPWALTAPFVGADSGRGFYYGDWMKEVDDRIGRVVAAIDSNGYHDNTIVILTADNGPENSAMSQSLSFGRDPNGPLRGNKRDVWDGGTRVPFVVRWPGQAAPGLVVSDLIWQGDCFATIAAYLGVELPEGTAPDGESFLNLLRGQQKPAPRRDSIVVASIRGDLGLKTTDGWKFIDSTGGGNSTSWDSSNRSIPDAAGTNRGVPKQLFHQAVDLGEDHNQISALTGDAEIRASLVDLTGRDLLGDLDRYRTNVTTEIFPRVPDNDGDTMPNAFENQYGLDPDAPGDASSDLDGDGAVNLAEKVAGTDPSNSNDLFRIIHTLDTPTHFEMTWPSVTNRMYQVHWSPGPLTSYPGSMYVGDGTARSALLDKAAMDAEDGIPGNLSQCFMWLEVFEP